MTQPPVYTQGAESFSRDVTTQSHSLMKTRATIYTATFAITLGCAGKITPREPAVLHAILPTPDSVLQTDFTNHYASAKQLFHLGNALYDHRSVSIVRVTIGDTIPHVDTTTVRALISASFEPLASDSLTIQADIIMDSITIQTRLGSPIQLPSQADTLIINTFTGRVNVPRIDNGLCNMQSQEGLVRVDDLVPVLLTTRTRTWSDTVVRQICRAGIQLKAYRVTRYQLDSMGVQLYRTTVTTFSGHGTQWNQAVESAGESVSTDTLFLDLARGRIHKISGTTQLQLEFKSQLRSQRFEQLTQRTVRLR
jgi:hypothetical protein